MPHEASKIAAFLVSTGLAPIPRRRWPGLILDELKRARREVHDMTDQAADRIQTIALHMLTAPTQPRVGDGQEQAAAYYEAIRAEFPDLTPDLFRRAFARAMALNQGCRDKPN